MSRTTSAVLLTALLPAMQMTAACSDPGVDGGVQVTVTDSAGVAIRTFGHSDDDLPTWTYEPDPVLEIGTLDGDGPDVFGRITSVTMRSGGGVVVSDGLAAEVRSFTGDGEHLGTLGGPGEGPGEFSNAVTLLRVSGDTVWAWDQRQRRVSVFVQGTFDRAWTAPAEWVLSRTSLIGGRLYGEANARFDGIPPNGLSRPEVQVVVVDEDGTATPLITVDGHERHLDIRMADGQIAGLRVFQSPFARGPFVGIIDTGAGPRIIGGPNDRFVLREWDGDGLLQAEHRYPRMDRPVTEAVMERARQRIRDRYDESSTELRETLARLEENVPEYRPAFDRVWGDDEERLWVRRSLEDGVEEWVVMSLEDLRPEAWLVLPSGFSLMEVRTGRLVGSWLDEFDVPHVRVYQLRAGD